MDETLPPNAIRKLDEMEARLGELEGRSADPSFAANPLAARRFMREIGSLRKIVEPYRTYRGVRQQVLEMEPLLETRADPDLQALAKEELPQLRARSATLAGVLLDSLLADPEDTNRNAIVEIRAGTGGEEAALFAKDLFRMYSRFAEAEGWKIEILAISESDMGGYKEVIFSMSGEDIFTRLRYESGGHRVQRVPVTETQGRIHTSAATVAVMPEVEEVELVIADKDLKIDALRASGPGGQHVNKTSSAIRITHLPTGLAVFCQEERSQHKNKSRAMSILRSRLYDAERQKRDSERAAFRKAQVGSGDRNERIRTYNFPQNRVTDHRINENFSLDQIVEGRLGPLLDRLLADERERRLKEI
jgi:peptide chain release factor 1